jgi:hypothetical protein
MFVSLVFNILQSMEVGEFFSRRQSNSNSGEQQFHGHSIDILMEPTANFCLAQLEILPLHQSTQLMIGNS